MIDVDLILTWAKRIAFVVLLVLWRMEARQSERLLGLLESTTDTASECVTSYRALVSLVTGEDRSQLSATAPGAS